MGRRMNYPRGFLACVLFVCVVMLPSCGKSAGVGSPAPGFTLPSIDGRQVSLSDLKGQVVAINFFAHW